MTEKDMVIRIFQLKKDIDQTETYLKELNKAYELIEKELHEYMMIQGLDRTGEYEGIGKVAFDGLTTFATYKKEDEKTFFEWLNTRGLGDIIKPTVHWKTLSAIITNDIETGTDTPEFINIYQKPKMKLVKQRSQV